jgi:hypothetical protein
MTNHIKRLLHLKIAKILTMSSDIQQIDQSNYLREEIPQPGQSNYFDHMIEEKIDSSFSIFKLEFICL